MEPVLIATDAAMTDVCAVQGFALDMAIGHDKQDFTATFEPVDGVGCGSLLYIDGTEYGGIVDDVTADTESGLVEHHGRTWDGMLAAKRILPPNDSAYRRVSGEANAVLASLVSLLDVSDVFAASTEDSGITVSNHDFPRFVDAYEGIMGMLGAVGAKLSIKRIGGSTVLAAVPARTVTDEADSDLMDFSVTKAARCVNHLVCAGEGEGTERVVLHLYADADGNVSQTQTFSGRDEITAFYDYNNADADELLEDGIKKLKEYQTNGSVDISSIGEGDWDVGDTLVARDNRLGITVSTPIAGKTVTVGAGTNWHLRVEYELGEVSRSAPSASGSGEVSYVFGVKGDAEADYRAGNVNLTPSNIGAVESDGGGITDAAAFCEALHVGDFVSKDQTTNVSMANSGYTNVTSINVTAGVWVVYANIAWASNATGRRHAYISTSSAASNLVRAASCNAVNSGATYQNLCGVTQLSATTTVYLVGWQNSGAALNATGYLRAVRIK